MTITLSAFNRGRVSRLGLARTDIDRVKMSAETQTNWIPRALGSMMLRPGLGYLGAIRNNAEARIVPFVFAATDTALLELTSTAMRVWIDDDLVSRSSANATITNGDFSSSDLSGWTANDETGSTSFWFDNLLAIKGTRYARGKRYQAVACLQGEQNISVKVVRGQPILRIGSSAGGDDLVTEKQLRPGHYSLSFTSELTAYYIELSANTEYASVIDSVTMESSGAMVVDSTWGSTDLTNLRWAQSNDVVFVSCLGLPQKRIERHGTQSWAIVDYVTNDGPFAPINTSARRIAPSALTGNVSLISDRPLFTPDHVGALFEITSIGQSVEQTFTSADQASNHIRVSGVSDGRTFQYDVSASGASEAIWIQRSIGEPGSWQTVNTLKFSANTASSYNDGLDNQIVFYRMFRPSTTSTDAADTSSGELTYAAGGITGIARVHGVSASTESTAVVLTAFGSTTFSELWSEGDWSPARGYPSAVALHEGRVFWAGKSKLWGSVSDAFESFDADSTELGDSGPINLNIASGSNEQISWLVSLTRLLMGSPRAESQAKTSSLEEPLTPTNFALRDISTQGSAAVQAVRIDQRALFVQASQTRVMEITLAQSQLDYDTLDRTLLTPEIGEPSITRVAVQRQPDTRLHFVRSDGTVAMLLTDPTENIMCWLDVKSTAANGAIEEVASLPGTVEDAVYYVVKREVNGSTVRYLEKWALESEARGGAVNKMADSFLYQTSTATTTVSGLDHLVGSSVIAWGATADLGSYTVSSTGTITLSQSATSVIVGLPYSGTWVSAKLAYGTPSGGSGLTARKRINHVGVVLADTHARGLQYGPSTSRLQYLPRIERSQVVSTDYVHTAYDNDPVVFPGSWDTDSRLVLLGTAPRPVTVLGAVIDMDTKEK